VELSGGCGQLVRTEREHKEVVKITSSGRTEFVAETQATLESISLKKITKPPSTVRYGTY